jgi:type IV pilus assembly protein PilQ
MVAPAAEIAEQERQQLETNRQLEELAPLRTEFIQVLYADAQEIFELFGDDGDTGSSESILSERGRVIVDDRTNSIILTETEAKIAEFRKLIERIDRPVRQVSIEARVVRAATDFEKSLGVVWGLATVNDILDRSDSGRTQTVLTGGQGALADISQGEDVVVTSGSGQFSGLVTDMRAASRGPAPGQFTIGFFKGSGFLSLELSALEASGRGEVVSQPKVVTQDQTEAQIRSGEEITLRVDTGEEDASTVTREAFLQLNVTPHITPDNRIMMAVEVTKDNISSINLDSVTIDRTQVETNVMVDNGETIVIGGIYEEASLRTTQKVPFFGDLPFLGRLFRQTAEIEDKLELLIFITPSILSDPIANR